MLRKLPILRGIEGAFQVVDVRRDLDPARQKCRITVRAFEFGQATQRKVYLGDGPVHPVVLKLLQETRLQILGIDKPEEGALRIGVGDDRASADLVTIGENDPGGSAVLHLNAYYLAGCPNLSVGFCRCRSHCRRERANASHDVGAVSYTHLTLPTK